jgi:HAD superfamily hydrolase (TIGR01509 family)
MIGAVLWDLDGTIVDNEALHFQSWQQTLRHYAIDYTYADFRRSFGRTNADIVPELLGERATPALVAEIAQAKEANFRTLVHSHGLTTLPSVQQWLGEFQRAGLPQAVASSGPMANIIAMLTGLDLGDYFQGIVSGARLPKGKPDPTIFRLAAAAVNCAPELCLVIEDSPAGIEAARRANMRSVAVGSVIHLPLLHERLAATPGPACYLVESLDRLTWELLETT